MSVPRQSIPGARRSALRLLPVLALAALLAGLLAAPVSGATSAGGATPVSGATPVAPAGAPVTGLRLIRGGFDRPLFVTHAGDGRLFVVEQGGRIRILKQVKGSWRITGTFLDLRAAVSQGGEQGLLGLAFHPDYPKNGRFYVDYTDRAGDTVIAEYRRSTAGKAAPGSRRVVMKVHQPFTNHNGGWIGFKGPYLYIALGDGGSGGDPLGNAQDRTSRLGKILRIDPLDPDGRGPRRYRIPADNPFVGRSGLDVIWALGLRNPWRNSFDRLTGDLWLGEVGQDLYEEIDHDGDARGRDFGWNVLEGRHRYPSGDLCTTGCRTLPVIEYEHDAQGGDNCAVVGGYVSRRAGAALAGRYLYGDSCSGRIWSTPADAPEPTPGTAFESGLPLTSFGEGADGAIYVTASNGGVYRVKGS